MQIVSSFIQYLLTQGILNQDILFQAQTHAKENQLPLLHSLIQQNLLDSTHIAKLAADFFHLPIQDLSQYDTTQVPSEYLTHPLIKQHYVLPLSVHKHYLLLAMADPSEQQAIEDFTFTFAQPCIVTLVDAKKLYITIQQLLQQHQKEQLHSSLTQIAILEPDLQPMRNEYQKDDAPVVAYIHQLLQDAVDQHISDIHCEPYFDLYRIRLRKDGILTEFASPPAHIAPRLVSRIKVMAALDITEKRLPQDGRFSFITRSHNTIDVRVSTCPVIYGEKVVLRLLNAESKILQLSELGLEHSQYNQLIQVLQQSSGLILVTGPTGSGKTITLYTLLQHLNTIERNICSAEDPVEIYLSGINQLGIQPHIGLDFSQALRSFLRQDPDVIMVGEIRDLETAAMACKAAQTGHLVLSTLHTQNAPAAVLRLQQLGVSMDILSNTLKLVVAQRLVRRLCTLCQSSIALPKVAEPLFSNRQCAHCYQGYQGRTGIFELLPILPEMQPWFMQTDIYGKLQNYAEKQAWLNLFSAGQLKITQGITSKQELHRVL